MSVVSATPAVRGILRQPEPSEAPPRLTHPAGRAARAAGPEGSLLPTERLRSQTLFSPGWLTPAIISDLRCRPRQNMRTNPEHSYSFSLVF